MNISEREKKPVNTEEELWRAEEEERKKGFMKDLGWGLLFYNALFCGLGFLSFKTNPYLSIFLFSAALLLDIVPTISYIKFRPQKKQQSHVTEEEIKKEAEEIAKS